MLFNVSSVESFLWLSCTERLLVNCCIKTQLRIAFTLFIFQIRHVLIGIAVLLLVSNLSYFYHFLGEHYRDLVLPRPSSCDLRVAEMIRWRSSIYKLWNVCFGEDRANGRQGRRHFVRSVISEGIRRFYNLRKRCAKLREFCGFSKHFCSGFDPFSLCQIPKREFSTLFRILLGILASERKLVLIVRKRVYFDFFLCGIVIKVYVYCKMVLKDNEWLINTFSVGG